MDQESERRIVVGCLALSVLLHLLLVASHYLLKMGAPDQSEWVLETEVVFDAVSGHDQHDSIRGAKKGESLKVAKRTLPQLPNQFQIDAKQATDASQKPGGAVGLPSDDGRAVAQSQGGTSDLVPPTDKSAVELKKRDALERLLKEQARKRKQFAKTHEAPEPDKLLVARKEALASRSSTSSISNAVKAYNRVLKGWVQRHYVLPEIYTAKDQQSRVVVEMVLNKRGEITALKLVKSSSNLAFDRLAVSTMRKAAPFPKPPREVAGRPIHYRFDPR